MVGVGGRAHGSNNIIASDLYRINRLPVLQLIFKSRMSEVADSMIFRQKLYETFKDSGLLSKLKTTLRANLLQKLEKPAELPLPPPEDKTQHFHLRGKFIDSAVAQFLKATGKEYSLSIFMAETDLEEEDCLRYSQLSEIINLNKPAGQKSFLFRLFEEFGNIKCIEARERSTQTDFDEPLSKKLQLVDREFKSKIDYWKLIPGSKLSKAPDLVDQEERLRGEFAAEKQRLKRQLEVTLKQQLQRKMENQYSFRLQEAKKQHEGRLNELRLREKTVLERLNKQKSELQEKHRALVEQERKMINKYQQKFHALEGQYLRKTKQLQAKQKDFWKKELELRAKKRQYEETIRLVKQKVVAESGSAG